MSKRHSHSGRRRGYSPERPTRASEPDKKPLDDIGLAVFRSLGGRSLDLCMDAFKEFTNNVSTISRGEGDQHGLALNLISLAEVRNRSFDRSISTQDVINEIYDGIPSLRKPMSIGIGKVGMFGGRNSLLRSFGVAIHEDERYRLRDERDEIIGILNEYSSPPLTREDWPLNDVPHVTIGKISMSSISDRQRKVLIGNMNNTLPETIQLDRATLHNPAK